MRTSKISSSLTIFVLRRPAISSVYANDSRRSYEIVLSKGLSVLDLGVVSKTRTHKTR